MTAAFHIFDIDAGGDWETILQFCDGVQVEGTDKYGSLIDLTGYSGRMQVREATDSATALATISTAGGGMEIDPLTGKIALRFTNAQTTAMAADNENHKRVFDVELTSPTGEVVPFVYGYINARANVTR